MERYLIQLEARQGDVHPLLLRVRGNLIYSRRVWQPAFYICDGFHTVIVSFRVYGSMIQIPYRRAYKGEENSIFSLFNLALVGVVLGDIFLKKMWP